MGTAGIKAPKRVLFVVLGLRRLRRRGVTEIRRHNPFCVCPQASKLRSIHSCPLRRVLPPTQTFSVVSVMSSRLFFTKARLFSPGPAFPAHDTPFGHHFTSRSPFTLYLTQSSHTWFLLRKISMPIVVPASDSIPRVLGPWTKMLSSFRYTVNN